jgi:sugar phosphate isomerase/epimerase
VLSGLRAGLSTGAIEAAWGDWTASVELAAAFGTDVVELCALGESTLESLMAYLDADGDRLQVFEYVSVHAPAQKAKGRWADVAPQLAWLPPLVRSVIVHPDLVKAPDIEVLRPLGERLCFENMDCTKETGRFADELDDVFAAFPEAGFCLDLAHVWTNDRSLRHADVLLERFGDRLRQVHVSGIDADARHRPMTSTDFALYGGLLARCSAVPVVLESVPVPQP